MAKKLSIAYLTSVYPRATDTFIRSEVEQLRKMDIDVQPFAIRRPGADQMISDQVRREAQRTIYLLSGSVRKLLWGMLVTALCSPRRTVAAVALLARTGAPGVKARARQLAYLLEACLLVRHLRRLGISHVHNHIGENSAHVAMLASVFGDVRYSLAIHGPNIFFAPHAWALGEKVARSSFTACISEFCKSQCMIFAPYVTWDRLKIVRCGVGPDYLDVPVTAMPTRPRFVCVGRLCPEKGQLVLLEAARRLAEENVDFEVVLVGDGQLRRQIEWWITRHDLTGRVQITGWMNSEQVRRQIISSRALVSASFAEGLPVVIMEAMATHRPVIATRIGGISELVEPGKTGWLVHAGSVDDLVAAMKQALLAPVDELAAMGEAGARKVAQQHNAALEAAKLARLFRAAERISLDGRVMQLPTPQTNATFAKT